MKKYLLTLLSILLFFCSQNSFAQSKKEGQDTTKNQGKSVPIKEYYESGKLKVEGFVKNNRYDSTFISYYENGQIEAKGSFKDCVYKRGNMTIKITVQSCAPSNRSVMLDETKKTGEWKYFYPNGILRKMENYLCGIEVGLLVEYDSSGVIKRKAFYSEEKIIDDKHYENGSINYLSLYNYERRLGEGNEYTIIEYVKYIQYYETGEVELIESRINGDTNGEYIEFWKNGFPMMKETYVDGLLEGESSEYYENGNRKSWKFFKNDEPHLKQRYYDEEGKIKKIETWKKGKLIKTEIPNQE